MSSLLDNYELFSIDQGSLYSDEFVYRVKFSIYSDELSESSDIDMSGIELVLFWIGKWILL